MLEVRSEKYELECLKLSRLPLKRAYNYNTISDRRSRKEGLSGVVSLSLRVAAASTRSVNGFVSLCRSNAESPPRSEKIFVYAVIIVKIFDSQSLKIEVAIS